MGLNFIVFYMYSLSSHLTYHVFFRFIFLMGVQFHHDKTSLVLYPLIILLRTYPLSESPLSPHESWFYSISTNTIEHGPHLHYVKLIFYCIEICLILASNAPRNNDTEAWKRESPHCFIRNVRNLFILSWDW